MIRSRAGYALLGTLLFVALGGTACSQSSPETASPAATNPASERAAISDGADPSSSPSAAPKVINIEGYPRDRSLAGLLAVPDVDTIVIVKATKTGDPHLVTPTANPGEDAMGNYVVTPIDARVDTVYRGTVNVKDPIRLVVGGGTVGDLQVIVGTEVAPSLKDIARYSRLVVAGKTITMDGLGTVLDPYYFYGVNGEGLVKSLMESAGNDGTFTLDALRTGLAQQR